jgi:hypothetical protein
MEELAAHLVGWRTGQERRRAIAGGAPSFREGILGEVASLLRIAEEAAEKREQRRLMGIYSSDEAG